MDVTFNFVVEGILSLIVAFLGIFGNFVLIFILKSKNCQILTLLIYETVTLFCIVMYNLQKQYKIMGESGDGISMTIVIVSNLIEITTLAATYNIVSICITELACAMKSHK